MMIIRAYMGMEMENLLRRQPGDFLFLFCFLK
jgi:hypothetical protein